MKNNKFLLAAILGGVTYFILGMIVYGMLLMNFMNEHSGLSKEIMDQVNRTPEQFNWWAMILSNLSSGFLIATIFTWGNINTAVEGAKAGAIIAILMAMGFDFVMYSTTHLMGLTAVATDIVAWAAINAIVGAIVGMILGKGAQKAAD